MFAPSILLACLIFGQTDPLLDQKVTFQCPATRAGAAIEEISRLSGAKLTTKTPISDEMLVLRLRDVPLRTAMDKVAAAATGEWTRTESGYVLSRPGTLIRAIEHKQRAARIAALKSLLAQRLKDFQVYDSASVTALFDSLRANPKGKPAPATPPGSPRPEPRSAVLSRRRPAERLLTRLLASMDVETLADLPHSRRTVFSTRPTAMQRPLSNAAYEAVQAFASEQQIWNRASADGQPVIPNRPSNAAESAEAVSPQTIAATADKLLMICVPDWDYGMIEVRIRIADRAGKVLSDTRTAVFTKPFDTPKDASADGGATDRKSAKAIVLSPLAKELQGLLAMDENGSRAGGKPISAALRAYLVDPEGHDPLALFPSEPILRSAEALDLNVAACVQDFDFQLSVSWEPNAQEALSANGTIKDGWFTSSSENPLRSQHEDRRALAAFLQSLAKEQRMTLDAKAAYAQGVDAFEGSLGGAISDALVPGGQSNASEEDWMFLRLYGVLSPTQRDVLHKGGTLPYTSLFSRQQTVVGQIVYGRDVEDIGGSGDEGAAPDQGSPFTAGSLASEPTELLPTGLDNRVMITMSASEEEALFASTKINDQVFPMELTDTDSIAMAMMGPVLKDILPEGFDQTLVGFRTGRKRTYSLKVNLPNRSSDSEDLVDAQMTPGPVFTYDKLPPETKKAIQDRIDEMTKVFKDMRAKGVTFDGRGSGQGTGVPPPR